MSKGGELEQRVKDFNADLTALLAKYKLALVALPNFIQTKDGTFNVMARVNVADDKKDNTPEPPVEKIEGELVNPE